MGFSIGFGLSLATLAEAMSMGNANLTGGLYAARPAVPSVGAIYASTDRQLLSVCLTAGVWLDMPGAVHGSGLYADIPASPHPGDTYAVTSGDQTGTRFSCFVDGSWEGSVQYATGHSWDRASPVAAGGGSVFLDEDTRQEYVSSGDASIGWNVRLPTRLGSDKAALDVVGGYVGAGSLDLSPLTLGACTVAVLFRWDGGVSAYDGLYGIGNPSTAANGINLFLHANGPNTDLITYQNGGVTVLVSSLNPSVGLHAIVIAPVSHDFGAGAVDAWAFSIDGGAVDFVAMASPYGPPSTASPLYLGRSGDGLNDFHGGICDFAVWASALSDARKQALSTLPGTATYRLPIGALDGVPWMRAEAGRFDTSFPSVLPTKFGTQTVALTVTGVTKTEY